MEVVMLLTVKMFKTLLGQILPFSKFSNFTLIVIRTQQRDIKEIISFYPVKTLQ